MFLRIILVLIFAANFSCSSLFAQPKVDIKTHSDSVAYSFGMNIGKYISDNIIKDSPGFNVDLMMSGLKDAIKNTTILTAEQMSICMQTFQQEMMEKQQKAQKEASEKNKKEADAFLAKNKKVEGVVTLPSGLQYKVIKQGTGKKPATTSKVKVHYTGKLITGETFDSSVERGEPITFPVTGVIKGWTEGLQLMTEGSKWTLYIPAELGYGDRGAPPKIGPGSALIFEVELLGVIDDAEQKDAPKNPPIQIKK